MYNGALGDMGLASDPLTGNRYAFGGGNPISNIELDGHGWLSDLGHAALDVAGMVPVVGAVADVANGAWYAAEGDYLDAGISFAGAIPVIGDAALGARMAVKGAKYAAEGAEALQGLKNADHLVNDAKALEHAGEDAADVDKAAQKAAQEQAAADKAAKEAAAQKAAKEAEEKAAAARAEAEAESAAESKAEKVAESCATKLSFAPDTPVLMGNGSTKAIKDIQVGDQVESANPKTGKLEGVRTVQHVWINHDDDLVDVAVRTEDGHTATLHTTSRHRFWDDSTHTWVPAGELKAGHALDTADGHHAFVVAVHATPGAADRWNLTIDQLHTYYVVAGGTPVLVHNTTPVPTPPGVIYLRTDLLSGEEYVGQAKSWSRYLKRQLEHARDYPNKSFSFEVLGRANPGQDLDVLEESWMRAGGGKKSVPGSGLENSRVQMNDARYKAAGGTVC